MDGKKRKWEKKAEEKKGLNRVITLIKKKYIYENKKQRVKKRK